MTKRNVRTIAFPGGAVAVGVLALGLVLSPAPARAQVSATVVMTADRTQVEVGEVFQLQIRADVTGAHAPDPELPDLSAFEVLSRQVSRPIQFRFGFGSSTQFIQSTVVYVFLLRARTPGRHELEPARLRVLGAEFRSNPLTIVVGGTGTTPPQGSGTGSNAPPKPLPSDANRSGQPGIDAMVRDDVAFLRTVVDRNDCWVGEQVTVTIYLYVRGGLREWPTATREPSTDGFWVHDLLPPVRSTEPVQIAGPYHVYVLRRFAAFPLRPGELTIGAMSATIPVGSIFDIFMGGGTASDLERTGVPVTVRVRELPSAGRPPGEPYVGRLTLEASLDRNQVPTGDAVTLTLRARGTGQVQALRIATPTIPGLRFLAPQSRDEISAPSDVVGGTKTIEWLVVPEREGAYEIPAFRVAVFDPATGSWSVASSEPLRLTAAGSPLGVAAAAPSQDGDSGGSAQHEEDETAGFGPVRTRSALTRQRTDLTARPWYPWALAAPPLAWLGLVVGGMVRRRIVARLERDVGGRASRQARKHLASAESAAKSGDVHACYAALSLALKSVIEGRLGESIGSMTYGQLGKHLLERGMDEGLARRVVEELEGIEFARFSARGGEEGEMRDGIERVRRLIVELERFVPTTPEDG